MMVINGFAAVDDVEPRVGLEWPLRVHDGDLIAFSVQLGLDMLLDSHSQLV